MASPPMVSACRNSLHTRAELRFCAFFVVLGVLWRAFYIFKGHPPTEHIFSDMQSYVDIATRFFAPGDRQGITDTSHPPGPAVYYGLLYNLDRSWSTACFAQFVVSVASMFLLHRLAYEMYGSRTACVALAMCAIYFPFIHYSGYFLAENPFTLALLCCAWLLWRALHSTTLARAVPLGFLTGLMVGVAVSLKNSALAPALLTTLGLSIWAYRQRQRTWPAVVVTAFLGFLLVLWPMAKRCTRLNEGHYCSITTNTATNVLIGHYGDKALFRWHDAPRRIEMVFGSPTSFQKGFSENVDFNFGVYDSEMNWRYVTKFIRENPWEALRLSFVHVYDLFFGRTLWPSANTLYIDWGELAQKCYWVFVLLPSVVWVLSRTRRIWQRTRDAARELLLFLPIVGMMGVVFLSLSEVRFRIPFDSFAIILAAQAYVTAYAALKRHREANDVGELEQLMWYGEV